MKFGKELASQMVPEWKEAYMDYDNLKTILKTISNHRNINRIPSPMAQSSTGTSLNRKMSLYRAFSGLTSAKNRNYSRTNSSDEDTEGDEVILISGEGSSYQTRFLMSSDQGGDNEQLFFRKLDEEFNKVVKFYQGKVEDIMKEAEELNKQMDAYIALSIKVDDPIVGAAKTPPSVHRRPERVSLDSIQEVEMSAEGDREEENKEVHNVQETHDNKKNNGGGNLNIFRPASIEVLNHVHINVAPETPISTLKSMLLLSETNLTFSHKELKKAEDLMKRVFIDFYEQLMLLKSYSHLNVLAFSKIMKKYDKITSRKASKAYLKMVDNSYIGNSDEIARLMKKVERTFVKYFADGNRRKGMEFLRPKTKKERHLTTFFLGLLIGCSIALIVTVLIVIRAWDIIHENNTFARNQYMDNVFPLYSLFGFIVLHMLMYAGNIFYWRRYRVNYSFIFGFKKGTELGYREVLLVSSCLAVLTIAGVLANLDMEMDPITKSFETWTELVPLALLLAVLMITFCPFNIIYRSSRYFLITCVFHCFLAPLYKVTLPDFFLADQLTSQVQSFRSVQFFICYYIWGDFTKRAHTCQSNDVYKVFLYVVAVIPYGMRFLQCMRRLIEEKGMSHAMNGLKYLSTIVALCMRTALEHKTLEPNVPPIDLRFWKVLAFSSSVVATVVNTYWDIVRDWGLLQRNSKNPWLRDKLLISHKSVYFVAIVSNIILRLAWMQMVLAIPGPSFLHKRAFIAFVACLEIIRRGIWNFFRLENEHLNNVGKYRAFKSVPLPFNYDNADEKEL